MAHIYRSYRINSRVFGLNIMIILLTLSLIYPQNSYGQKNEIPKLAIQNLLMGLESENDGVKLSCAYFSGKYKILDVSPKLVETIKSSKNNELCWMLVWSLYQIGDDTCCMELQSVVKNHPLEDIKKLCTYLQKIKEYENAIAQN